MSRRSPFGFDAERHERWHPWASLAARLALCLLVTWALARFLPGYGALFAIPLWARAFVEELMAVGSWLWRLPARLATHEQQGRYYAFKGIPIRVEEDLNGVAQRWIHLEDLGRALGERPREITLRSLDAEALCEFQKQLYVKDEVLLRYLAARSSDRAARLRVWVERTIWHPARQRQRR